MRFYGVSSSFRFISIVLLLIVFSWGMVESGATLTFSNRPAICKTVTVDKSGHGNFSTIQSAIDSIPSNNNQWIRIHVRRGIYREKVMIPQDKPFIMLEGEGKAQTIIAWGDHEELDTSATFSSFADNFMARYISFKNTYNDVPAPGHNKNPRIPAAAALVSGSKSAFYECGFYGLQDTLWDLQGLHYFKRCFIEGAVDFIFGKGQSIYEKCDISVMALAANLYPADAELQGFITAQGRESSEETNGFVFIRCNVFGNGKAYLGRAWRNHSRVLFYQSYLSDVVNSKGWDAWNSSGHENAISYSEYQCTGPGSDMSKRVTWVNKLNPPMLKWMSGRTFVDEEGWIHQQP